MIAGTQSGVQSAGDQVPLIGEDRELQPVPGDYTKEAANQQAPSRSEKIQLLLTDIAVSAAQQGLVLTALEECAVQLQSEAQKRPMTRHELCGLFAQAAEACELTPLTNFVRDETTRMLIHHEVPPWAARIAAHGLTTAARHLALSMSGREYAIALRLLGILICPALDYCPWEVQFSRNAIQEVMAREAGSTGPQAPA